MGYSTINFPRIFNVSTGKTQLASGTTSINQCLGLLLTSSKQELYGDPMFGSNLMKYIFEPNDVILRELVVTDIIETINLYEKRITVSENDIYIESDGSSVNITIDYYINESDEYGTLELALTLNNIMSDMAVTSNE